MSRIQPALIGKTAFEQLLGHDETVMRQWSALSDRLTSNGTLSSELKEQVRRTLAQANGCDYCQAKGKPNPDAFDERTALAVGFSDVFLKLKGKTPASSIHVLQETFTDTEISELCAFIAFMTASQYVGGMLGLTRENPLNV